MKSVYNSVYRRMKVKEIEDFTLYILYPTLEINKENSAAFVAAQVQEVLGGMYGITPGEIMMKRIGL